jgi:hypothetical protein
MESPSLDLVRNHLLFPFRPSVTKWRAFSNIAAAKPHDEDQSGDFEPFGQG